ncbi:mucin-associated surface protein (MASP) [Trypanosoma cruzi]|nr:mucin-associated surface protein (MASP) [Trypanosoma cruzi]
MAMMMTGRVLLVCALCVLWCDACGGGRAEPPSPESSDTQPEKKPKKEEEPVGVTGQDVKNGQQKVPQAAAPEALVSQEKPVESLQPQQSGGAPKPESPTKDSKVKNTEEKKEEQKKEEAKAEDEDEEEEEEEDDTKEEKEEEKEVDGANEEEEGDTKEEEAVTGTAEGTQQAVKSSQVYLPLRREHRI